MVNFTNYPFSAYEPNQPAACTFAFLVGLSLIVWIIQCIQSRFIPRRISILLLISHLTIFAELVLRVIFSTGMQKSRARYTAGTALLAIGQRLIIVANYDFLLQARAIQPSFARIIRILTIVCVIVSAALLSTAEQLSHKTKMIKTSFLLRQISASIVLCLTELFYLLWFLTRTSKDIGIKAIILLGIASFSSLVVSVFHTFISVPDYYLPTREQEFWSYIFQLAPIIIAQLTWTLLHPKRSLLPNYEQAELEAI
ncbi:unnamed protein product [Adineta steineri]|uniref:Uncharacterized protein n=1 Tax=Adineta steineri TaxID=433720 RepID=A0A814WGJ4_9BILA|nr:unnamed protein product [Adineta steineri]CAF3965101.1 unnamed protein product [Adineta steineri]